MSLSLDLAPIRSTARRLILLAACLCSFGFAPAQAADEPFRLGLILDMSGPYAGRAGQGSVVAAEMAVKDFGGTVLGRRIEILSADHRNSLERAATIARKWFDMRNLEAILDVSGESPALGVQQIAKARKRIALFNSTGTWRLTLRACEPYAVRYSFGTDALLRSAIRALTNSGTRSWFVIEPPAMDAKTREHTLAWVVKSGSPAWLGLQIEDGIEEIDRVQGISKLIASSGGNVWGTAEVELNASTLSAALSVSENLQPDATAIVAPMTASAVEEASRAAIASKRKIVIAPQIPISTIHEVGLEKIQGLITSSGFYWDLNDRTRAWSNRFYKLTNRMPTMEQAGVYSATLHYLKAVASAKTTRAADVMRRMRDTTVNDFFATNGRIRADGVMVHDINVFRIKSPAESRGAWDYLQPVATIPAESAFEPLAGSDCR